MAEQQPWPAKGDQVAVYTSRGSYTHAILIGVARLTDKQIVLDDGSRYWRHDLWQVGGDGQLLRANDTRVADHLSRKATETLGHDLDRLFREYRNNLTGGAAERTVVVLAQAAGLIEATRVAVGLASAGSTEGT